MHRSYRSLLFTLKSAKMSSHTSVITRTVALLCVLTFLAGSGLFAYDDVSTKFAPGLMKIFSSREGAGFSSKYSPEDAAPCFIVYMKGKPDIPLKKSMSRLEYRRAVVRSMKENAVKSQAALIVLLKQLQSEGRVKAWQSFFSANCAAVEGDLYSAEKIAELDSVRIVTPNYRVRQSPVIQKKSPTPEKSDSRISAYNWNVDVLDAERVWSDFGVTGEGVVMASIASGVEWEHPALKNSYRGWDGENASHDYNWFNPDGELHGDDFGASVTDEPADAGELGTFTMGCAVGDGQTINTSIGVAPGAEWITVTPNGLQTAGTFRDDIMMHKCFQWLLAPTDLSGEAATADSSLSPDVVFCGFSTMNPYDETFRENIQSLRSAGIFVVAPAGDVGSASGGAASPGSMPEVFSTGAVNRWGEIYELSGRGPSAWGEIKPDAVAPGVDVYGAIPGDSYEDGFNGTAIAAAHAAGVYALLRSAEPTLGMDILRTVMKDTCSELGDNGPDNAFGWGYLNAWRALNILRGGGLVKGTVTDANTGDPIENVTVHAVSRTNPDDSITTTTRADGTFEFPLPPGTYDITFTSLMYETGTLEGMVVEDGFTILASKKLKPRTTYRLSGRALDAKYGTPLFSTIVIENTNLKFVTDNSGEYHFDLPEGTYTLKVTAAAHRSEHAEITISSDMTKDFRLPRAPKILLVDAEARYGWDQGWKVMSYYERALDRADYAYTSLSIDAPWDLPSLQDMNGYDIVVWAQANRGFSSIEAENLLRAYLNGGGRLLICGQDIGLYDGDTELYTDYFHAEYIHDDAAAKAASGANPLAGAEITFGGAGSSQRPEGSPSSYMPDIISPAMDSAIPCAYYSGGQVAGLAVSPCGSPYYRVIYLAFGLESVSPGDQLYQMVDQAIQWLNKASETYAVHVSPGDASGSGEIGRSHVYYQTITNMGALSDTFELSIQNSDWDVTIWNEDLTQQITDTGTLAPCEKNTIAVKVDVPNTALPLSSDAATLEVKSTGNSSAVQNVELKTFAFVNWITESTMLTRRYRQASEGNGCSVYVIGGMDWESGEAMSVNECYDTRSGTWTVRAPKLTPAANCGSAVMDGKILLVGGFNLSLVPSRLSRIEAYDPETDSWELTASLPVHASGVACAAFDGHLYTFGGFNGSEETAAAWKYNPDTDRWSALPDMPGGGRYQTEAAVADGKIYVIGGWPNLKRVECFDPETETWTEKSAMSQGRHSFGCETVIQEDGEFVYVFGGGTSWVGIAQAERYDPSEDKWEPVYSLSDDRRAGMSSALAGGKLHAFGGVWDQPAEFVETLPVEGTLSNTKISVSSENAAPGDALDYEIDLSNGGFLGLEGVSLSNRLSPYVSYVQGTASEGLTYDSQSKTLSWNGDLSPNEKKTMTFQAKITNVPYPMAVVENVLELSGDPCGVITRKTQTVIDGPDFTRSYKSVDKESAAPNDILNYTIYLVNHSDEYDAAGLQLLDPLPEDVSYVADSVTGGATYNSGENRIEWSGDLLKFSSGGFEAQYEDSDGGAISYDWKTADNLLSLEGDDVSQSVNIGFPFTFFGETYEQVGVSANGYLSFQQNLSDPDNECLPDASTPNALIAPFWDDLIVAPFAGDGVWTGSFGEEPDRAFVIRWKAHDFSDLGNENPAYEFQAVLHEKEGEVTFQYKAMDGAPLGDGSSATVGIENADGDIGMHYICNGEPADNAIHDDLAVRFKHVKQSFLDEETFTFQARIDNDASMCNHVISNRASLLYNNYDIDLATSTTVNATPISMSSYAPDQEQCFPGDTVAFTLNIVNGSSRLFADVAAYCSIPEWTTFERITQSSAVYNAEENRVEWIDLVGPGVTQPVTFEVKVDDPLANGVKLESRADVTAECAPEEVHIDAVSSVANYELTETGIFSNPEETAAGAIVEYSIILKNSGARDVSPTLSSTIPTQLKILPDSVSATNGNINFDFQFNRVNWTGTVPGLSTVTILFQGQVKQSVPMGTEIEIPIQIDHPNGTLDRSVITVVTESGQSPPAGWLIR